MSGKKVVIIGAGIAGLSAGCYLQMNGYNSEIFELHDISGGLCTGWERKGYTFDGCIHWLVGSGPANELNDIWTELGGLNKETQIVNPEMFTRIENMEGKHFSVFTNADKLEAEMLRLSSKDEEIIKEFTEALRFFVSFSFTREKPATPELQKALGEKIQTFYRKWASMPIVDFARKISEPFLHQAFLRIFGDFLGNTSPIIMLIATLGYMHSKNAGYPIGGSLPFAKRIEERYLALGGKIHFKARVKKILVENDKANGIQLESGEKIQAEIVISAADGYDTIFNMLEGKYIDEEIRGYYEKLTPFPPICQVSFGIADDFKGIPSTIQFLLQKPLTVDPITNLNELSIRIFNFDPTLAPTGKTAVVSILTSKDYEYWTNMRKNNHEKYKKEKDRLANEIINHLENRFPNISKKIEVVDIATPATFIRYTNNWKGSYEGWLPDIEHMGMSLTETLPDLQNFFMIGHWTQPGGGLPPAAMSARKIVSIICKEDGKDFTTSKSSN